nr:MAG TPA: hypothetical protein [Caudoviricetes sp.]
MSSHMILRNFFILFSFFLSVFCCFAQIFTVYL